LAEHWGEIKTDIFDLCKEYLEQDSNSATDVIRLLLQVCEKTRENDYIPMGDCLDTILPKLYGYVSSQNTIDVDENGWRLYSSNSGYLTLQRLSDGKQLLSMVDPMWAARLHARTLYNPQQQRFYIMGCELGYLAYSLYKLSDGVLDLYVFDKHPELMQYAIDFGVLGLIPPDKLHICATEDEYELIERYCDGCDDGEKGVIGYFCYDWAITDFEEDVRLIMVHFNVSNDTTTRISQDTRTNFYRNLKNS